jgi:hypothetical protein
MPQTISEWSSNVRREIRRTILAWLKPSLLEEEISRDRLNTIFRERWEIEDCGIYEMVQERYSAPEDPGRPNFIVWLDMQLDVDWVYKGDLADEANELVTSAEAVQARRCKHLPIEQIVEFKRIVGHAVVSGLQGSNPAAEKLIKEAERFLKDRTVERSRIWTLLNAHFIFVLLVLIVLAIVQLGGNQLSGAGPGLLVTASGGLLGSYLSVIQNANKGKWDAAAGMAAHCTEVATKLVAGLFTGAVVFVLSRSVHAPESIKALTTDYYSQFILGLVSGFSERLIPKVVTHYSAKDFSPD